MSVDVGCVGYFIFVLFILQIVYCFTHWAFSFTKVNDRSHRWTTHNDRARRPPPLLRVARERAGSASVDNHVDKRGREEAALVRLRLQDALHPVVVLRRLGQDDDDVALLEGELVFVVSLAVVEGAAPPVPRQVQPGLN